ncbi:formate dehydrogenase subunit gamma [Fluviibacterium sp. S390]|uniref:formate dehydrogenase subunit gamma n=1 Tax=Fluviibacterium sp. S390 TaxID=3415139 RepID=UPI003C7CF8E4
MLKHAVLALFLCLGSLTAAAAQEATPETTAAPDRSGTGGAQTLEDILARQRGEKIDDSFRRNATGDPDAAAAIAAQLGTLGGASDSEVYRALRYGSADVTVSNDGPASNVLIQDSGMRWLEFRQGPLATYGGYALLGMIGLLLLFYLLRGKIRIDGEKTGRKILRFSSIERFGHWLFAGSFLLLAFTGLIVFFGRKGLIPLLGKDAYAQLALISKWIHNNVAWAFMLGLVMITVMWLVHNIPNRHDLKWFAVAGGLFSKNVHPPARKFNGGQKIIFWSCVVLGVSISISGLSLLFPFELPMFAKTFVVLNDTPIPGWLGLGTLPEQMPPHQEMQLSQAWHAIVAFLFMAIIIAHIYLGSVGMEGAFDAMGSGEVEEQWAREHHGLWVKELEEKGKTATASGGQHSPAE